MKHKAYAIVALALIGLCVYLFFALFESYRTTEDTGWSAAARRNPYLAAQQYLERLGIQVETVDTLYNNNALGDADTLFVEDSSDVLTRQRVAALVQWVKNGGHLIVAADYSSIDNSDPLLDYFDVTVHTSECDCGKYPGPLALETLIENTDTAADDEAADDQSAENAESPSQRSLSDWLREYNRQVAEGGVGDAMPPREERIDPDQLTTLGFDGVDEDIRVYFNPNWALYHPAFNLEGDETYDGIAPFYWSGSDWGVHFMQLEVGDGMVSITADPGIWQSDEIGYFDHAYLFHILTDYSERVQLLVGSTMPSIFALIWRYASEVVIAFGCWLGLWLLYRGRRFLPSLPLTVTVRRSMAEHIEAVGQFLWRHRFSDTLLQPLRDDIERRAGLYVDGYAGMDTDRRHRALAQYCDMPPATVAGAMTRRGIDDETRFTDIVQSLQTIRSRL